MNNFLITGFGRSGTKFLSEVMNKSKQWTVAHEPRGYEDIMRIQPTMSMLQEFQCDYYGEVNSYLRYQWFEVPAKTYGFIYRNPRDIIMSIANRNDEKKTMSLVDEVYDYMLMQKEIQAANEDNHIFINFENFTTNKDYLNDTLNAFGITDVDVDSIDLSVKVNKNKNITYKTFEDLPDKIKDKCYER